MKDNQYRKQIQNCKRNKVEKRSGRNNFFFTLKRKKEWTMKNTKGVKKKNKRKKRIKKDKVKRKKKKQEGNGKILTISHSYKKKKEKKTEKEEKTLLYKNAQPIVNFFYLKTDKNNHSLRFSHFLW